MSIGQQEAEEFVKRFLVTPTEARMPLYLELESRTGVPAPELREALESMDSQRYLVERIQLFEAGDLQRNRDQLIVLVEKIIRAEGSEAETDEWLRVIGANVPAPIGYVTELILQGGNDLPRAADVVDAAMSYASKVTYL